MKHVRRFGVAFFTFLLGVGISPIQFYIDGTGRGKVIEGGGPFSITSYTSSYFVRLVSARAVHVSPGKADEVFTQHLDEALKVFEVGPKINPEGAVVGRRAMALFFSHEASVHYTEIWWTDGDVIHYISSRSALHVREFEKQHR